MLPELFEYNHSTNAQMIVKCIENKHEINDKIIHLFSHILNAHQIWNNRITGKSDLSFEVFQLHDLEKWSTINQGNYDSTCEILKGENSLTSSIRYTNSKGESYENKVEEILFHIINHSNYHRAQINSELVKLGIKAVVTDYIFHKRK